MVCDNCTKKLSKLVTPEVKRFKEEMMDSKTKVKASSNKLLDRYKNRFEYTNKCIICKGRTEGRHTKFCHHCSYTKGICEMCGKKVMDVGMYKQSEV